MHHVLPFINKIHIVRSGHTKFPLASSEFRTK
nr:MAG TPA: GTP cyclohydrolase 1 [Caudoviricetes sp.]